MVIISSSNSLNICIIAALQFRGPFRASSNCLLSPFLHTQKCSRGHPVSAHLGGQSMISQSSCSHTFSREAPAPCRPICEGLRAHLTARQLSNLPSVFSHPGPLQLPLRLCAASSPQGCAESFPSPAPADSHSGSCCPVASSSSVITGFVVFFWGGRGRWEGVTCLPLHSVIEAPSMTMGFGGWLGPDQKRSHTP